MARGFGRLRLQQQLLVVVVRGQHAEGIGGRFGRTECRRAGVVQHAPQGPHARIAHETGHHRLLGRRRNLRQLARDGGHVGQGVGRQQHQHAVHARVVQDNVEHGANALGRHGQVGDDGVGDGGVGLQHVGQRALRGGREVRAQHGGVRADQVHGELRRPAAVGDQCNAAALGAARVAQHLHGREQLHEVAHAHGAGPAQRRVEDGIAAVGVRAPCLEHDDRLDAGRGPQRAHEFARGSDVFKIEDDAVRARIAGQVVQQLGQAHHGLVAQRHGGGKADVHVLGPVHDGGHDRARLRHQRHASGAGQHRVLAEIQARVRPLRAEGPRPEEFAVVFLGPGAAQRQRAARVWVGQFVGQQDDRAGRQRRQPAQGFRQHGGRDANQGQIRTVARSQAFQPVRQVGRRAGFDRDDRGLRLQGGRQGTCRGQRPVGHDHQRAGFEHGRKSVSQHGEVGPGPVHTNLK